MSSQHYYVVSLFNKSFKTLDDAKWNVKIAFTPAEAKKYLCNESILHYIGDCIYSTTPIYVDDDGNISFGRTQLEIPFN